MRHIGAIILAGWLGSAATPLAAQQWTDRLFKETTYDFGVVPRNAKLRHAFAVTNPYNQPLHIAEVKPGCGCTAVVVGATTIPPGGKTYLEAILNTRNFTGVKNSGLTVTFDQPYYGQVFLAVKSFIRGDVVIDPEQIDFGSVVRGTPASQVIRLMYAGRPDWRIERVASANPHVQAEAREIRRAGDRVDYQITATLLPTTPAGYLKDSVTVVTNDTGNPTVPIDVLAQVRSNLTLSPASLSLGSVSPGQTAEQKLVVRGSQPFKIVRIAGQTGGWSAQGSAYSPTLWIVTVRYRAGTTGGPVRHRFRIVTDLKGEPPLDATATATIGSENPEPGAGQAVPGSVVSE